MRFPPELLILVLAVLLWGIILIPFVYIMRHWGFHI